MKVLPDYASIIIVGVVNHGKFKWFVSDYEFWFMDLSSTYPEGDPQFEDLRFGITILDGKTVSAFFSHMREYEVTTDTLREKLSSISKGNASSGDLDDWYPSLYIDFDHQILKSAFPEPTSFEDYVPDGWKSSREEFCMLIPKEERYWLSNQASLLPLIP